MSSDRPTSHRPSARSLTALALLCSAVALGLACGHKKPPKPPPSKVPQKVTLAVHQRGGEAIVNFPYPTTTISGTLLDGVGKVEIWRLAVEVPEFAVELLAEEEARRDEAQQLLDDLGLPLYEAPAAVPGAPGPAGAPAPGTELPGTEASGSAATDAATAATEDPEAASEEDVAVAEGAAPDEEEGAGESGEGAGEEGDDAAADGEAAPELSEEEQLQLRIDAARNLLRSPPRPKSDFIQATAKDFRSDSELWYEAEGEAIDAALIGDRVVLRLPLPARPAEGPEIGYVIAARVRSLQGKPSDFSNLVSLLPAATPPAPQQVTVAAQADGVHVEWTSEEDPKNGFRVYRREAQTRTYGDPVGSVAATERSFVDRGAIYGARYIYAVTSLSSLTPLLESDISSEHEIDYQDRFGPPVPSGLVAFPEAGRVRLLWATVIDADLAGYEVLRRAAGEDEAAVVSAELVVGGQYLDQGLAAGEYFYAVRAVDRVGNRSAVSAETPARVP